jgi:hypothetical protein
MGKSQINEVLNELNDRRYKDNNYVEVKLQRNVKRINIYRLISHNGKIIKQSKFVRMKQFKDYVGLSNNKDAKIVGFTPNYIGVKPSKPIISRNYFNEYINNSWNNIKTNYPNCFKFINISLNSRRVVFDAGFDTSFEHLRENISQSSFKYSREQVLEILDKSNFKWFRTPLIDLKDPTELKTSVNYNPKSRPGLYTSMLISRKRSFSHIYSQHATLQLFENIKKYPLKNYCLWEILGREKDIKVNNTNEIKEVSTRMVISTEEYVTNLASWPAQKAQLALELYSDNKKFHLRGEFNTKNHLIYSSRDLIMIFI